MLRCHTVVQLISGELPVEIVEAHGDAILAIAQAAAQAATLAEREAWIALSFGRGNSLVSGSERIACRFCLRYTERIDGCQPRPRDIGHKDDCSVAAAIRARGEGNA